MNNKILVLLPTLNELENIKILIKQIKNLRIELDLLFIDDNSKDGTQDFIKLLKYQNSNIKYIFNKSRLGIGKAHKTGLLYALENNYHYIITMDSDLAHHPNYIKKILNKKNSAALIVGSRYIKKNSTPFWPMFRIFLSNCAHVVYKIIYNSDLDSTNSFRFYNLKILNLKKINKFSYNDYEFFFTSLLILTKEKYKIIQIPMKIYGRSKGNSKMLIKHIIKSTIAMFLFYFKLRKI